MQRLSQRLSVSQFSSFRWSFFQDVIKYSKLGFQSIGLWRQKVDEFGFDEAADLLFEMRMNVSSISWAGGFTGSEGNSYKLAVEDAIDAIHQAHLVGAKNLIVHPGGRNGHTETHALRLVKSGLREILPLAQDFGVQLLVEPNIKARNPWSFINSCDTYLHLLDNFGDSELGLVLDLFHIGNDQDFLKKLPLYANRIELVQIADATYRNHERVRCPLGQGNIPINHWLNLLSDCDYCGDFEIELHGFEFENAVYENLLEQSQNFLAATGSGILSSTSSN